MWVLLVALLKALEHTQRYNERLSVFDMQHAFSVWSEFTLSFFI